MCSAVAEALESRTHLVVEAPTGIGKTFALAASAATWLAAEADPEDPRRVVITTATKALQDQLVDEDLPRVATAAADLDAAFGFSVLKGRSNYLCLARTAEAAGSLLDEDRELASGLESDATTAGSGDRTRLREVSDSAWQALSTSAADCPGARHCSHGTSCWAEQARRDAESADVVVVNTALYAAHLLADGDVLPPHEAVIVDEAHALADLLVDAASVSVSPARLRALERAARSLASPEDARRLQRAADGLASALDGAEGEQDATAGDLAVALAEARSAAGAIGRAAASESEDEAQRTARAFSNLSADLAVMTDGDELDRVVWSERDGRLRCAPVRAADLGARLLWPGRTVVCTSATLQGADARGRRTFAPFLAGLGTPARATTLAVDSPFDHASQAMLYVPKGRIPSPRQEGWAAGVVDELWHLVCAAQGRTLALFTSRAATEAAATELRRRVAEAGDPAEGAGIEVLTQWDGARHRLIGALRRRRRVVICATRSFWTGIDIPGDACVVVAIDRLPFPRPDDPLIRARRQRAEAEGENAFLSVDVPMAATQLAQGVGRLIRSGEDRGVVAVLDTRLADAGWRQRILGALPAFRRTIDPDEVATFLTQS